MKLTLAIAGLFLMVSASAAKAGEGERIPAPAISSPSVTAAVPPADVEENTVTPGFCATIDAKLAACRAADPKKIKKAAFPVAGTAAIKQKRKDARAKTAKARELCAIVKAQRAAADKVRADGGENAGAAALNMGRQSDLVERTASALLDEALQLLNEIGECPSWKAPSAVKKTRLNK